MPKMAYPVEKSIDPNGSHPGVQIAEHISDLKSVDVTELDPIQWTIGDTILEFFETCPQDNIELSFDYEGYRVEASNDYSVSYSKL